MTDCVTTRVAATSTCIEAVMHPFRSLEVVIFAETRTGNNGRQEKTVLLACSLFAMKIQ